MNIPTVKIVNEIIAVIIFKFEYGGLSPQQRVRKM